MKLRQRPYITPQLGLKAVQGFALGLTAHAIGTARGLQMHPTVGAFAALAMGLNGVATAVAMPLVVALFARLQP